MTLGQSRALFDTYQSLLQERNLEKIAPYDHLVWMSREGQTFTDPDKAQRWVGFIQGVLWANDVRTISELRHDVIAVKELDL